MVLVIDNYDSFTYNLVQIVGASGAETIVRRNDAVNIEEIRKIGPSGVLISPGPGRPEDAGITVPVIREFGGKIPILGVCLGHQAIGFAFGGIVGYAPGLMHGKTSQVRHNGSPLYRGVSDPFTATRYHSLVVQGEGLPSELEVSAWTEDGVIMGIRHKRFRIDGVQFHPESILTREGEKIVGNWLEGLS
jgi:anthranilate synthase/aminodeoxychorismate synthase-like glutamine amidotransferase